MVLTEKMKYLNIEEIWTIDPLSLYKEVTEKDLAFYQWNTYLTNRLSDESQKIKNNNLVHDSYHILITKIK